MEIIIQKVRSSVIKFVHVAKDSKIISTFLVVPYSEKAQLSIIFSFISCFHSASTGWSIHVQLLCEVNIKRRICAVSLQYVHTFT